MDQKPSVGRIVHIKIFPSGNEEAAAECVAAIITKVLTVGICVTVFEPGNNPYPMKSVKDEDWHWPERV